MSDSAKGSNEEDGGKKKVGDAPKAEEEGGTGSKGVKGEVKGESSAAKASDPAAAAPPVPPKGEEGSGSGVLGPLPTHRRSKDAPMHKLSVNLLATYRGINEVYYKRKRERRAKEAATRKSYDYEVKEGEVIRGRYKVVGTLGKGSFGQVVTALDLQTVVGDDDDGTGKAARAALGSAAAKILDDADAEEVKYKKVAIKLIKSKEAFRRQAKTEIALLQTLNRMDPEDQWCIVRFTDKFEHRGHVCLVFEHLSINLYELLRRTRFRGMSLVHVRKFARQILKTLAFLSLPDIDIVHCDLKPENILFRRPDRSGLKVVDFGSSCKRTQQMYVYIQSRFYRSPEVILGLPYDQAIDMWSLGCILVELHVGTPLFSGRDEGDQMRRFVALKGLPPRHMLQRGKKVRTFFDKVSSETTSAKDLRSKRRAIHHALQKSSSSSSSPSPYTQPPPENDSTTEAETEADVDAPIFPTRASSIVWGEDGEPESDGEVEGVHPAAWRVSTEYVRQLHRSHFTQAKTSTRAQGDDDDDDEEVEEDHEKIYDDCDDDDDNGVSSKSTKKHTSHTEGDKKMDIDDTGAIEAAPTTKSSSSAAAADISSAEADHETSEYRASVMESARELASKEEAAESASWLKLSMEERRALVASRRKRRAQTLESRALPSIYAVKPRPKPMTSRDPKVHTSLFELFGADSGGPKGHSEESVESVHTYRLFIDLIERMLEWDPAVRIKPMEALNHPFLRQDLSAPSSSSSASLSAHDRKPERPSAATVAAAAAAEAASPKRNF